MDTPPHERLDEAVRADAIGGEADAIGGEIVGAPGSVVGHWAQHPVA
jgi:hypothetical protein